MFFGKLKKSTAVVVAIAMSAAIMLAGCGGSANPPATSTDAALASPAAGTPEEKVKITVSVYDRGSCDPAEGTMAKNRWTDWVNENAPVEVEYISVPRWEATKMWMNMLASGTAPDLIMEYDVNSKNLMYTQKLIQPIDGLIEQSTNYKALTEKYPGMLILGKKADGKVYDFVSVGYRYEGKYLAYRADWLEKLGIDPPTTDTELFDAMKAVSKAKLGGENTYGYNLGGPGQFILSMMYGQGTIGADWFNPWYLENDHIVMNWDKIGAYVSFQKNLYDQGIVDRDFLTDTNGEKAYQDWLNGKLGFACLNQGVSDTSNYSTLIQNSPGAKIGFLKIPSTQFGTYGMGSSTGLGSIGVVNAACKNPEAVMKYVDFMLEDSTIKHFVLGEDEKYFKLNAGGLYEELNSDKTNLELNYNISYQMVFSDVLNSYKYSKAVAEDEMSKAADAVLKLKKETYRVNTPAPLDNVQNLPALDDQLAVSMTNASQNCRDIIAQIIVGGSKMTVEKGMKECKAAWEAAGGDQIIKYYDDWYQANKGLALTNKDIVDLPWEK